MATATRTAAELEELVRDGDRTITPADIAAARQHEEHAALVAEAERRAEVRGAEAEHAKQVAQLRDDILAVENRTDEQTACATAAMAALEDLLVSLQARADAVRELGARAKALGIPELDGQNNVGDDTGIGWKYDHTSRAVHKLRIDDRMIGSTEPRHVLNRLVFEFLAGHKMASTDHVPHKPLTDLLADQDSVVVPPKMARVRLLQRHGHRQAGTTAEYELSTAHWLVAKGMAEPAA